MATRRRQRRTYETPEFAAMVRRMVRAYARRVADADDADLAEMLAVASELDAAIVQAVAGQRARGESWTYIGRGAGITRQSAHERWARRVEQLRAVEPCAYPGDVDRQDHDHRACLDAL